MSVVLSEHAILDLYQGQVKTIRTQRCMGCHRALAFEISDKIGFGGDYWIIDSVAKQKEGLEHYFKHSDSWFGNTIQCPSCGRTGKLPIDKPLNWENMEQQRKEASNAISSDG